MRQGYRYFNDCLWNKHEIILTLQLLVGLYGGYPAPVSDKTPYCIISQSMEAQDLYLKLLEIGKHIGSNAVDMPVQFQSDTIIQTTNLVASRFHETLR